jgi:hypothetical protein
MRFVEQIGMSASDSMRAAIVGIPAYFVLRAQVGYGKNGIIIGNKRG